MNINNWNQYLLGLWAAEEVCLIQLEEDGDQYFCDCDQETVVKILESRNN